MNYLVDKWVDVQVCDDPSKYQRVEVDERTVFVGGLPWDITKERLEGHFVRFGRIQRVGLKKNEQTGRPRGFAFVIYSKKEDADACLLERWHKLDNHVVDVKKAIPPSEKNKSVLLKPVEQCIKRCIVQSVKKFH